MAGIILKPKYGMHPHYSGGVLCFPDNWETSSWVKLGLPSLKKNINYQDCVVGGEFPKCEGLFLPEMASRHPSLSRMKVESVSCRPYSFLWHLTGTLVSTEMLLKGKSSFICMASHN